jgi:hypothetical protein
MKNYNMKNLCTLSDKNYLLQGLSLYFSLKKYSSDFVLYYLCLDDESYKKLTELNLPDLKPFHVNKLIEADDILKNLREANYSYFCWCLASYFSNYLLKNSDNSITYIDSDIYFHNDINILYENIKNKDVGIFKHRQFTFEQNRPEGAFNVGVVYFKNSVQGRLVSNWWADAVLNKKYPDFSTCGDQKYLDHFTELCTDEEIFIDGNIGHGAPWQWQLYDYSKINEGKIIYNGEEQIYLFSHFSKIKIDLNNKTFIHSTMHQPYTNNNLIFNTPEINKLYVDYFNEILEINKKYF